MESQIFIATLMYKKVIREENGHLEYIFEVLGPMMGTLDKNGVFLNTHDREYYSMDNIKMIHPKKIRYTYYNLISLEEAKDKYKVDDVEKIISMYLEEYKKSSYFVISKEDTEPIIIAFLKDKFKRKYESNIAKIVY